MLTILSPHRGAASASSGPARQLYLMLREAPDRQAAEAWLEQRLADATPLTPDWPAELNALSDWLAQRSRARADAWRQYQAARAAGAARRHFGTLAQARRFLTVQAPALLTDGAWLYSVLDHWRQPLCAPLVELYLAYLGRGIPSANQVAQVRQALAVQACSQWQEGEDSHFLQGANRLALACAGERYLPELLGYQLGAAEQPAAHPAVLQELGELGIALLPPPEAQQAVLMVLHGLLAGMGDAAALLRRVQAGHALARLGSQALPVTPEGSAQDPAIGTAPALAPAPAAEPPRAILRHDFPPDEHAWEVLANDLSLLEAQIAACASKGEAMSMLARHMAPALHHQPLGLMASRVYSQLFALG